MIRFGNTGTTYIPDSSVSIARNSGKGTVLHVLSNNLHRMREMCKVFATFRETLPVTFGGRLTRAKIKVKQQ
jgi:hypothetical protein